MPPSTELEALSASVAALAAELRQTFLGKPFGIIRFWGFGLVRPNDQSFVLVSTHADADRLDLAFVAEGGAGLPGIISIWAPEGLEPAPETVGVGIAIRSAERLRLDDNEAIRTGTQFHLRTPRGEGDWPITSAPALVLAR